MIKRCRGKSKDVAVDSTRASSNLWLKLHGEQEVTKEEREANLTKMRNASKKKYGE